MSIELARTHLDRFGRGGDIIETEESKATVELAAAALGVSPGEIAKTISLYTEDRTAAILVVASGDAKIANPKFKARFGTKARLLAPGDVEPMSGHAIGGVCPFGNPDSAQVWLDASLKRFDTVYPAAGGANTTIALTLGDLETISGARGWVDVTKLPETA
ncbi:prolyl-tRNA editing enzyme YbaK/EbsC (Cys-tRNA(Pro) deacylase) [Nocardioides luteus]|uniref:Proline--tRNA ligase n=1 Tax=Nocardioides luteus TaxID=1844 RepID=A0ABQ5SRM7_9ACTN|nr:YbaK/EbsC family protein [Nocardioides luteus]MDR7311255.1 prolyl-tRNA editing enzyme YbaK/EbsC (Cys-tRNA(Pro) deacylase) [Nocardioides luteus]GGR70849.1 proline--tRNA ligase [Nocardioides luteus]GLJ66802.1 proline--tRNA ligase [Nocardioides luteus]